MSGVFVSNTLRFLFHSLQPEIRGRDSLEALMSLLTHLSGGSYCPGEAVSRAREEALCGGGECQAAVLQTRLWAADTE